MLGPAGWRVLWVFLALVLYNYSPYIDLSLEELSLPGRKAGFVRAQQLRDGAAPLLPRGRSAARGAGAELRPLSARGRLPTVPRRPAAAGPGRETSRLGGGFWKRTIKNHLFLSGGEKRVCCSPRARGHLGVGTSRVWGQRGVPSLPLRGAGRPLRVPVRTSAVINYLAAPIISCEQIGSDLEVIARIIPASGSDDLC